MTLRAFLPFLLLGLLACGGKHSDSYRPGSTGDSWTYRDSTSTNGRGVVRERIEELGRDTVLVRAGREIACRTLVLRRGVERISRMWFSEDDGLWIHRLDHLGADEYILYDPPYPMMASPLAEPGTLAVRLELFRRGDSEPYRGFDSELQVRNEWITRDVRGKSRQVLRQTLAETGPAGITYTKDWVKGLGKVREEARGGSSRGPSVYSLIELVD